MKIDKVDEYAVARRDISFIIKSLIITVLVTGSISFLLPSRDDIKSVKTPVTKIYAKSLVTNPEALIMISEYYEGQGKMEEAYASTRLAIGILEKYNGNQNALEKYYKRLDELGLKIR